MEFLIQESLLLAQWPILILVLNRGQVSPHQLRLGVVVNILTYLLELG